MFGSVWQVLRHQGVGSFSTVWLVKHIHTKQIAVAKVTPHKDARSVEMIKMEIDCMSRLKNHVNICQLYQFYHLNGATVLILEYIEGIHLFSILESQGTCTTSFIKDVATQILSALHFMHSRGVLWRDLKLDNVMITSKGVIKCIDFNLSTTFQPGQKLKDACGTPQFASPFVLFAGVFQQEYLADSSVDLWPFAVVIYGLSTGRFPLHSKIAQDLLVEQRQISQGLKSVYIPPTLDKDLANLLAMLLRPGQRPTLEMTMQHPFFGSSFALKVDERPRIVSTASELTLVATPSPASPACYSL